MYTIELSNFSEFNYVRVQLQTHVTLSTILKHRINTDPSGKIMKSSNYPNREHTPRRGLLPNTKERKQTEEREEETNSASRGSTTPTQSRQRHKSRGP